MLRLITVTLCVLLFNACTPSVSREVVATKGIDEPAKKRPKNIILMIGDGMGLAQITAGLYQNNNRLNLEQFPYVGLHKNYPADEEDGLITDSAAGATSFACGVKTYNAAIGVGVDSLPRTTILELAERKGLATGLVVTCNIQHATPASFIAHNKDRKDYEGIALDFLKTDIDLFIGGGKKYFDNRADGRDLLEELRKKNYQVTNWTETDIDKLKFTGQNAAYITANEQPLMTSQGRDYLPIASEKACNFLQNRSKNGFFMMIEGSQIDWGGHAGNTDYIITEMLDFDKSIGKVLEFAKKDGNTLVIVTADHETGGFAILKGSQFGKVVGGFASPFEGKGTTQSRYHTGSMIPVFAYGPGAEQFTGIYENTAIFIKMKALFGF